MLSELIDVPGGTLLMGSADHYPEEAPVVAVEVAAFQIEQHPVTNAQFAAFVAETGYTTVAERPLTGPIYDHLSAAEKQPGSLVFTPTSGPVPLTDYQQWWRWVPGAQWQLPQGPESKARPKPQHPVVHIAHEDALAYATWAGRRLLTEAEHEWAARGGTGINPDGSYTEYAWGSELRPQGKLMANTWQGDFPYRNTGAHGFKGTSPVGKFGVNGYGLADMIGNVWEWTSTLWAADHAEHAKAPCCGGAPAQAGQLQFVAKGGSHLCAPEYCLRYRPAARIPQTQESSTTHMGFRCAL